MPVHTIEPIYDERSEVLVLGSFPSVATRAAGYPYAHAQNRFWRVMAAVLGEELPGDYAGRREMLLRHGVALWDVIHSCDIVGSSDSSITNVVPNDVGRIFKTGNIRAVYINGQTAKRLYDKWLLPVTGMEAVVLPSTSPANASYSFERLCEIWAQIGEKQAGS